MLIKVVFSVIILNLVISLNNLYKRKSKNVYLSSFLEMSTKSDTINSAVIEKKSFKRFMQIECQYRNTELASLYPILCSIELACRDINRQVY